MTEDDAWADVRPPGDIADLDPMIFRTLRDTMPPALRLTPPQIRQIINRVLPLIEWHGRQTRPSLPGHEHWYAIGDRHCGFTVDAGRCTHHDDIPTPGAS